MKKSFSSIAAALVLAVSCTAPDYVSMVNVFSGTDGNGHCHPCACTPFGSIQAGPQAGSVAWECCGGYRGADTLVMGFSQNRVDGTGSSELGDVLMTPFTGEPIKDDYRSHFDKASEKAWPGYYSCHLDGSGILAEVAAAKHVAFHRYTPTGGQPVLMLMDLQSAQIGSESRMFKRVVESWQDYSDSTLITGYTHSKAWNDREIYYAVKFNRPYKIAATLELRDPDEKIARKVLDFGDSTEPLMAKVSISIESVEGALRNIETEVPHWDIEKVCSDARKVWNEYLGRIDIKGSDTQKRIFYTSMYHLMMHPNDISDEAAEPFYSTLSLWDTFRAAHPLFTIITPEIVDGVVNSFMRYYDRQGFLPMWCLGGTDNYGMIGNHSIPVIVDAYLKGFRGFDAGKFYDAIVRSTSENHIKYDWKAYDRCGYFPYDNPATLVESVSRTLECCYDDWCTGVLARKLGHDEDALFYERRASYWKNVFDPTYRLMRGRDSLGGWRTPFDPFLIGHFRTGGDFTEGNSWQYTWHVLHDAQGLIGAMGGKEEFVTKLDSLFTISSQVRGTGATVDVSGLIGQYAHGNEPSHHVIYLYTLAGRQDKAAELIHRTWTSQYLDAPDGLSGNDDCGQMSAWYIFSALGFYPVNPCGGEYVLGAPQLPEMTLHLASGKDFTVTAQNISDENIYVKSVKLNGQPYNLATISHEDIMKGGTLEFEMSNNK
ncbi:MAG: GH92 family glycosyl hydrolase [Bacteroidales bacterium]|nr:GH92 family glycosyl hydrolase [Bacteroidales bacterium]